MLLGVRKSPSITSTLYFLCKYCIIIFAKFLNYAGPNSEVEGMFPPFLCHFCVKNNKNFLQLSL